MNRWVLMAGLALLGAAACDSPSDVYLGPARSTGGSPSAVGGTASGYGGQTPSQDGLIQMPDGWVPTGEMFALELEAAALEMVVDVSSSMNLVAPGGTSSRWIVARDALLGALGSLPETAAVGAEFFPNMPTGVFRVAQPPAACVSQAGNVGLAPLGPVGSTGREALDQALLTLTIPEGCGTPTLDGYRLGLAAMSGVSLPSNQVLWLVTDGQPTYAEGCVGDGEPTSDPAALQALTDPIVTEIGQAFASGIETFVIGLPGSDEGSTAGFDSRAWLSRAARAGGALRADCSDAGSPTYCHFDLASSENLGQDLGEVLAAISSTLRGCRYGVPQPPDGVLFDPTCANVSYRAGDGTPYGLVANQVSPCRLGWRYTDSTATELEICGSTCDRIKGDPGAQVNLFFGCDLIPPG